MGDRPGPGGADTPPPTPPPPPDSPTANVARSASAKRADSLARKALQQSAESGLPDTRRFESTRASEPDTSCIYSQRAFKKSSQNGKLTLYLASRDLVVTAGKIDKLQGVLLIDPEILQDKKVYGQVTLTFRYGREDEEVMGLKFCNEAIMSLAQLYPPYHPTDRQEPTTAFQEVLVKRFHPNAHPFTMAVTPLAPPSVQLVPAKEYNGAPIGTSYDIRVYAAERPDEKLTRKMQIIKMGIRVIQGANSPPLPRSLVYGPATPSAATPAVSCPGTTSPKPPAERSADDDNEIKPDEEPAIPHAVVEKQFLLSDGRVRLEANLDRAIYGHGDSITVHVNVTNNSNKSVKRIEADIVQHVDVCMFSNGKFKNIVAQLSSRDGCPVEPGFSLTRTYTLRPEKGATKNWIALEDDPGYAKSGANLASTVVCAGTAPEDRNVFAIYVSYYVKVKIVVSPIGEWIGGVVSLKLPFTLMHSFEPDLYNLPSPPFMASRILDKIETVDDPNEDPLPFIDKDSTSDEDQNDLDDKKSDDNPSDTPPNGESNGTTAAISGEASSAAEVKQTTACVEAAIAQTSTTTTTSPEPRIPSVSKERQDSLLNADLIEQCEEKGEREGST